MTVVRISPATSGVPSSFFFTSYRELKGILFPLASSIVISPAAAIAPGDGRSSLGGAEDGTCGRPAIILYMY